MITRTIGLRSILRSHGVNMRRDQSLSHTSSYHIKTSKLNGKFLIWLNDVVCKKRSVSSSSLKDPSVYDGDNGKNSYRAIPDVGLAKRGIKSINVTANSLSTNSGAVNVTRSTLDRQHAPSNPVCASTLPTMIPLSSGMSSTPIISFPRNASAGGSWLLSGTTQPASPWKLYS